MDGSQTKNKNPAPQKTVGGQSILNRRLYGSWIDGFMEYTKDLPSPEIFRKWSAIAAVAGALERKVWIYVPAFKANLYPNMYTVLVGPPATGKTIVTSITQDLWGKLGDHHVAPNAVSRASLMDALRDAERALIIPTQTPPQVKFNSLLIVANELGVFVPSYDPDFMNTLTDIYDGKRYGEKKRGNDLSYVIQHPQLNLIAATTPSYLNGVMPEGAWDQGFISRVMLIYSGEQSTRDIFVGTPDQANEFSELLSDLKLIGKMYGKFVFAEDCAKAISAWAKLRGPPVPEHPKLQHYNGRRITHLLKLCMVSAASRGNDFVIQLDHYHEALDWLLEAETYMPDIFKSMAQGGDAKAIEDTWYYAYEFYMRKKANIPEARLYEFLQNRVPSHSVERIIQVMCKAGLLEKMIDGFRPRAKKEV